MKAAITLNLIPDFIEGPFILHTNLAEGFKSAAEFGYAGIELFPASASDINVQEIKSLCSLYHVEVAAIGTGAGWVKHQLCLTDDDFHIRQQARAFIGSMIDVAGQLGAPAILGSMQGRWNKNVSQTQALAWLGEDLEIFGRQAESYNVPFLYEFLNRYESNLCNRVEDSLSLLRSLRTQNVKLLCDFFHMNIEEADLGAALQLAGRSIGHIHFADSNRQAVGFGHTDMTPLMTALRSVGYDGFISAEVFAWPTPQSAAEQTIRSILRLTAAE